MTETNGSGNFSSLLEHFSCTAILRSFVLFGDLPPWVRAADLRLVMPSSFFGVVECRVDMHSS